MTTEEIHRPPTAAERRARDVAASATRLRDDIARARADRGHHGHDLVIGVRATDVERVLDGLLHAQQLIEAHNKAALRLAAFFIDEEPTAQAANRSEGLDRP